NAYGWREPRASGRRRRRPLRDEREGSSTHQVTHSRSLQSPDHQSPTSLFLYGGFVNQHDGDVVLNRVHALARRAFERGAVLDERDGRLAVGAGENLEELGIDRHGRTI